MKLFHGISYHKLPIVDYQPIIHHINIDRDRSHVRCSHIIDVSIIIIGHIVRYSHRYELCIIRNDMRIPRSGHVLLLRILWGDGRTSSILRLLNKTLISSKTRSDHLAARSVRPCFLSVHLACADDESAGYPPSSNCRLIFRMAYRVKC